MSLETLNPAITSLDFFDGETHVYISVEFRRDCNSLLVHAPRLGWLTHDGEWNKGRFVYQTSEPWSDIPAADVLAAAAHAVRVIRGGSK